MLAFEYGVCTNVSSQGLGCGFLDVWSPCHPSVEGDTHVSYGVHSMTLKQ
jgi:hypothetical protein